MGGQGFQKGIAANENNLDANHGGRVKQQWLGSSSREAGERMTVGSGRHPGWKVEPRKSQIGVSEGQHSERNVWENKMKWNSRNIYPELLLGKRWRIKWNSKLVEFKEQKGCGTIMTDVKNWHEDEEIWGEVVGAHGVPRLFLVQPSWAVWNWKSGEEDQHWCINHLGLRK